MSREFQTLKEKIQYLFAKIDAGEAILPVELDLLKAYSNGLAQEIESNGTDLLEHFSKNENESGQKQTVIDKQESISQKRETAPDKSSESEKIAGPEAEKSAPPITEKEKTAELFSKEPTQVPDEKEKQANKEETATPEPEKTPDKAVDKAEKSAAENEVKTATEKPLEAEKDPDSKTEKVHGSNNGKQTEEEVELDEDYGIGLKFKQAKPLRELIDLSEKYVFIQCLFDHDPDRFSKALRKMDEAGGVSEALDILNNYLVVADEAEKQSEELLQKLKTYLRIRFS